MCDGLTYGMGLGYDERHDDFNDTTGTTGLARDLDFLAGFFLSNSSCVINTKLCTMNMNLNMIIHRWYPEYRRDN